MLFHRALVFVSCAAFAAPLAQAQSSLTTGPRASGPIDATKVTPPTLASQPQIAAPTSFASAPGAGLLLASSWSDDFNRPDASTLGVDWTVQTGSFSIISNRGAAVGGGNQWVRHASATAAYDTIAQSIDFFPPPFAQLMYVALISGVGASTDAVFVKLQDNDSNGQFDRIYLYRGINGSPFTTPYFYDLATPLSSGRMTVAATNAGDTIQIEIDANFDGQPEETFAPSGVLAAGLVLGTNFGVGCYNQPRFDNWSVGQPPVVIANFCTAGTTSNGCLATLSGAGVPSITQASGFVVQTSNVEGQKQGLYFYGITGEVAFPWGLSNGWFCVKTPTQRFALQNSGGTSGQCDGVLSVDFTAFLAANGGALGAPFNAGDQVWMQSWFRDPPTSKTTMLSDGLTFVMQP